MDNLEENKTIFILLPDHTVVGGIIKKLVKEFDGTYRIDTNDGRMFHRTKQQIFPDDRNARAMAFVNKFKYRLAIGQPIEEIWKIVDEDVADLVLEKWPEKLL